MSYFRRLRGSDSDDENGASNMDAESSTERFTAYSLRAGGKNSPARRTETAAGEGSTARPEPAGTAAELPTTSPNNPAAYEELGEHVRTVLSSADEAAKRLQTSATKEAKRIRGEAEDYSRETRAAADAYAEQRRESAETEASAITAEAQKRARDVRSVAEKQATDIQRDAIARREALLQESERSEERLRNLLKVFRAMTERIENLVSTADARGSDTTATSVEADLTEALADSRGAASATVGESRARG